MPILSPTDTNPSIKIELPQSLIEQCQAYAKFAKIHSLDQVIEKSLRYVIDADKAFKKYQKSQQKK